MNKDIGTAAFFTSQIDLFVTFSDIHPVVLSLSHCVLMNLLRTRLEINVTCRD